MNQRVGVDLCSINLAMDKMSANPISRIKRFLSRKWLLLGGIAVVVAFAAIVTVGWLSIAITSYPSCLTYQSNENAQLDGLLKASFGDYLVAHGFRAVSSESGAINWDSRSAFVQWSGGWLNVCTRNEESMDWLNVAHDLQQISLRAHWSPEAYLHVNPDITSCKTGNGMPLDFPIDFKKIGMFIKIVKATCTGVR
ncbi:hypothetical protein [Massilia sp. WG5]|uniref:hypothetical protein n=1 Tax=Massilia sp. WG5 TaxID=1707785 RepID=UPI0013A58399|nr:hypothetical protein [Massilia sp. WG5]